MTIWSGFGGGDAGVIFWGGMVLIILSLFFGLLAALFFLDRRNRSLKAAIARAHAKEQARSYFFATMGHELRTPMTGVLGMAGLLLETELDSDQRGYAQAIASSGRSLLSLLDEILDTAKIESARFQRAPVVFSVTDVIQLAVELMAPRAQGRGLEIATFVDPSVPSEVSGEPQRLRQVLFNLIGNAIKYTEKGGILVSVSLPSGVQDGIAHLRLEVTDTGPGISKEDLQRIFAPYEQIEKQDLSAKLGGGVGLGLAISRDLVERMGGEIGVTSEVGRGTTFWFTWPVVSVRTAECCSKPLSHRTVCFAQEGMTSRVFERYLVVYGARIIPFDRQAWLSGQYAREGVDVFVDSKFPEYEKMFRKRFSERSGQVRYPATWLIVRPEERQGARSLMDHGVLGYFIKPVRRDSLLKGLMSPLKEDRLSSERGEGVAISNILLVEDNPINALLGRTILEKMGYHVEHQADGTLALSFLEKALAEGRPPCLILMDVEMPVLDGYETSRRIRALEHAVSCPPIPILALTANAHQDDKEKCFQAGMNGFLTKPFDRSDLEEWLDNGFSGTKTWGQNSQSLS